MAFSESLDEVVAANGNGLLGTHESWERVRLRDVATILNGFAFKSSEFGRDQGVPLLRIRDVLRDHTEATYTGEYDPLYLVQPGALVVGMDGDFNCALWAGPPALLNQRVCRIGVDEEVYSLRFLLYALPGYLSAINAATSSVTVKHLSSRTIEDIPLPLPPLNEQRRNVEVIETQFTRLDAAVAALERARANLKRYRAAVLAAACSGRLAPTEAELAHREGRAYEPAAALLDRILAERRARWEAAELAKLQAKGTLPKNDAWKSSYKEPTPPDTADLPELPEGWTWASTDQLSHRITDGEHQTPPRTNQGVYLLSARNVRNGELSLDEVDFISEETYQQLAKRLTVDMGDVLLSCSGTVGRSCVVPVGLRFALVRSVAVVKPTLGMGRYLSFALRSPALQGQIDQLKTQTAQANIFQGSIKRLIIPLPPLAEQNRIVAEVERRLSVLDDMERAIAANLQRAARTRQAILKRAFAGQLVPQDPTDEPASVLLERIRAERAAQTPTGRQRAPRRRINARQHMLPLGTDDEE